MGIFARGRAKQPAEYGKGTGIAISKGQIFGLLVGIGFLGFLVTTDTQIPSGIIAAIGGIAFVMLFFATMRYPELALYGMVAYLPFSKILPGDFGGAAAGVNMTNLFMAIIIFGWMSSGASGSTKHWEHHPLHIPIILFAIWGVVSFFHSITVLGWWVFTDRVSDVKRWLDPIIIYFLFFHVIQDKRRWKTVVVVLLIGVFMAAFSAVWEYQTDSGGGSLESERIGGIAQQPNILGAFFVYYMFIYASFWLENVAKAKAWLNLLPFVVCLRGIMVTFSRGAYLAFATGILGITFFKNKILFVLTCVAIAFVLMNPWMLPAGIRMRLESTFKPNTQLADPYGTGGAEEVEGHLDKSSQMRLVIWRAGLAMVKSHPFVGVGFGEFQNAVGHYSDEVAQIDAHNAYVIMAAELGIPALILFVVMLLTLMWYTSRVYELETDPFIRATALGFLGGLSGLLMANMFGSRLNSVEVAGYFWILAALIARAHKWVMDEHRDRRDTEAAEAKSRRPGIRLSPREQRLLDAKKQQGQTPPPLAQRRRPGSPPPRKTGKPRRAGDVRRPDEGGGWTDRDATGRFQ